MPPLYRKPRGERLRDQITRRLFTLDSLPKDCSSPEAHSLGSHLLPAKEMPPAAWSGIQIPIRRTALSIRLAKRPVAAFVVAFLSWCHPRRQRVRTALPGGTACVMHAASVFACAKNIARAWSWLPPPPFSALYLQPTPPRRRLKHACDHSRTGYQSGGRRGSCVNQSLHLESSVGELVAQLGNSRF